MIITLTPEEIIKRCLWIEYKKFILKNKSEQELEQIVQKNLPFSINENDAYVIGLLKVIETTNLIHRFKQHINENLDVKSTIQEVIEDEQKNKRVLINKSAILHECMSFKDRFPIYYIIDKDFTKSVVELNEFITTKYQELDKLEIIVLTKLVNGQNKKITYLYSNNVSKLFKV